MIESGAVQPLHRRRLAVIYVRQSTPNQVATHRESLELQYSLRERAQRAGWDPGLIRVIDADLGRSGRTAEGRVGFQELVALVNQERVGIIFAYEATRLARNCTDWYHLLDLCSLRQCLVGDQDSIYDPATANGRLLLGLKGLISELELHTIRARLVAGLLNKARRGDLALPLPAGLVRDAMGVVVKHPSVEVQTRLELVFATFTRLGAVSRVLRCFHDEGLLVPRRDRFGEVVWRPASVTRVLQILTNPAYAGTFAFGRTQVVPGPPGARSARKRMPPAEWKIRVPDKYPAYIDWPLFEKIQAMIEDNRSHYANQRNRGVPRSGEALLHGIVYCGACGHKMKVIYQGGARYICNDHHLACHAGLCQRVLAGPVDDFVAGAFLEALAPAELDLYQEAVAALQRQEQQWRQAGQQQLERLRYQAHLAERQFNQADPDNRLVTAELEKRWEAALRELQEAEQIRQHAEEQPPAVAALGPQERRCFLEAGRRLPELWRQQQLSAAQRKAFLRCLVDKVVLRQQASDTVAIRIVWKGGAVSAAVRPVPVGAFWRLSRKAELESEVLALAKAGHSDIAIARALTDKGYRSPRATALLPSSVQHIRLQHRQLCARGKSRPGRVSGYLTVPQVARRLRVDSHWIYDRIHNGTITATRDEATGLYVFPDAPKTVKLFKQLRAGKLLELTFTQEH